MVFRYQFRARDYHCEELGIRICSSQVISALLIIISLGDAVGELFGVALIDGEGFDTSLEALLPEELIDAADNAVKSSLTFVAPAIRPVTQGMMDTSWDTRSFG